MKWGRQKREHCGLCLSVFSLTGGPDACVNVIVPVCLFESVFVVVYVFICDLFYVCMCQFMYVVIRVRLLPVPTHVFICAAFLCLSACMSYIWIFGRGEKGEGRGEGDPTQRINHTI